MDQHTKNLTELHQNIIETRLHATVPHTDKSKPIWVRQSGVGEGENNFVIFLKEEITSSPKFHSLLMFILKYLHEKGVTIPRCIYLPGKYLQKSSTYDKHYRELHDGSVMVVSKSSDRLKALLSRYSDAKVVCSEIFLQLYGKFMGITAASLFVLFQNVSSVRIDTFTYATPLKFKDEVFIVINAHYPYQRERHFHEDSYIIAFECFADLSWEQINKIGKDIDDIPSQVPESLYDLLYLQRQQYEIHIDSNFDGIHVSASPFEAMIEIVNLFPSTQLQNTSFYQKLIKDGILGMVITQNMGRRFTEIAKATRRKDEQESVKIIRKILLE